MKHLIPVTKKRISRYTNTRKGEVKFGEIVSIFSKDISLQNCPEKYVLLGIPEDIGVLANYGRPGTKQAWENCLQSLCNIQANEMTQANNLIILGEIDCHSEIEDATVLHKKSTNYLEKLGALVSRIDNKVTHVITTIITANKIPIIIGGGHNNAYGNIKGTSIALNSPINAINFDAHSDYRPLEHRHSGNGFSYAKKEHFLNHYFIFGLHINYTSQKMFEQMNAAFQTIQFATFEDIKINHKSTFQQSIKIAEQFICNAPFGLEIDLDAIENMGSSAMNPVGFSVNEARNFTNHFAKHPNCSYIHICEGAPNFELYQNQIGKILTYLISDILNT